MCISCEYLHTVILLKHHSYFACSNSVIRKSQNNFQRADLPNNHATAREACAVLFSYKFHWISNKTIGVLFFTES